MPQVAARSVGACLIHLFSIRVGWIPSPDKLTAADVVSANDTGRHTWSETINDHGSRNHQIANDRWCACDLILEGFMFGQSQTQTDLTVVAKIRAAAGEGF